MSKNIPNLYSDTNDHRGRGKRNKHKPKITFSDSDEEEGKSGDEPVNTPHKLKKQLTSYPAFPSKMVSFI